MAGEIRIRMVSEINQKGFREAEQGLEEVETKYKQTTDKILANAKGSIPKMVKNYKAILESSVNNAPEQAGKYFHNWAKALIYNFSGGDAVKLKAQIEKAVAEITNVGGEGNLAFIDKEGLNRSLREVTALYNESASGIESASARKQAMFDKEVVVLRKLGLQQEEYNLTMSNARQQMMALSPSMRNYEEEMERLSNEYLKAKKNLDALTAEQEKATKGGLGRYIGTVAKGMLIHQAVANAIRTVRQTLKEASLASAEAEQKFNKLNTVFEGLEDSAKRTASELSNTLGVAVSTSASALTTIGDLLQGQGMGVSESLKVASDWAKRFSDIIAFKDINESLDTFSSNMMAGFLGNTRNLRSVGVIIKDSAVNAELARRNLDKLVGSERELAKMNIRAEMTFKQLDNAMGATEREWETNLAVNRRLNEQWLQYKENLGNTINTVLKPMKSAWADLLTQINKANKAQQEYNEGNENIKLYDVKNNADDRYAMEKALRNLGRNNHGVYANTQWWGMSGYSYGASSDDVSNLFGGKSGYFDEAVDELNSFIVMFGMTVGQLTYYMEEMGLEGKISADVLSILVDMEKKRNERIKEQAEIEARSNSLTSASESFSKFQEALLGITGVNFTASDFSNIASRASGSDKAMNSALGLMAEWSASNIQSAIKSITEADLSIWSETIKGELEGLDMAGLLEAKMESITQLFTEVWNEALKDGVIDDDERKNLNDLKKLYKDTNAELEKYNAGLERQKTLMTSLDSMLNNASEYQKKYEQLGMDEDAKALDDLNRSFATLLTSLGLSGAEFDALAEQYEENADLMSEADRKRYEESLEEINKLTNAHANEVSWLVKLQKVQSENERKEKAKNAILERQNALTETYTSINQLRMTDEEKALDDLRIAYENQVKELTLTSDEANELYEAYKAQVTALSQLQVLTKAYNDELEREEERKKAIADYDSQRNDYATQLANLGKTDAEITRNGLLESAYQAKWSGDGDDELYNSIISTLQAFDLLQEALAKIDKEATVKNLNEQFSGLAYVTELATLRMDDNEKALYQLDTQYEEAKKKMEALGEDTSTLTANYNAQRTALINLQDETKKYNDELEREAKIKGFSDSTTNYRELLNNLGKSNEEIQRAKMEVELQKALTDGDIQLYNAIMFNIQAFDEYNEALAKSKEEVSSFADNITKGLFGKYADTGWAKGIGGAIANSTGGQIIQAGIEGGSAGGAWGAILGVLMAILSKTESFEKILNMVEPVIQMFDTLLKPLVPAIQAITDTLNTLVLSMIRPLLPLIKIMAEVIVLISTPIKMIHAIIDNIYIGVHNIVDDLTNWGRDQWGYNSISDIMYETAEQLETIKNINFDIKKNTAKDNSDVLKAYEEMFDRQMITATEFDALVSRLNGVNYSRTRSYNGSSWTNGSGGTTVVYNGDMKFTIEGTNLSANDIAEAVIRKQRQWATTAQYH